MPDHARELWELLGTLRARPEGLRFDGELFAYGSYLVPSQKASLAILRDAARRLCDVESVRIDWATQSKGVIHTWGVVDPNLNMIADCLNTYEAALIAALQWIIEQEASDG